MATCIGVLRVTVGIGITLCSRGLHGHLLWKSARKASEKVERSLYMLCKFFLLEEILEVEAEEVGKKIPSLCGQESLGS